MKTVTQPPQHPTGTDSAEEPLETPTHSPKTYTINAHCLIPIGNIELTVEANSPKEALKAARKKFYADPSQFISSRDADEMGACDFESWVSHDPLEENASVEASPKSK